MKIIYGTNKNLRKLILNHQYAVVHYCMTDCPQMIDNYVAFSTLEKYKEITFISIDAEQTASAKKIVEEFQRPLVAIYHKGLLIESQSVSSSEEMKAMLDKLIKLKT